MKTVFIAHQVSGDIGANIRSALRWARWALIERQVAPVVPYAYLCQFLGDANTVDRELGTVCSMEILKRCEEIWVCGPLPNKESDVWKEVLEAERMNKKVLDLTNLILPPEYANFTQT